MYDNKGNLVYKSALDLDFYENEAYYLVDLLTEQKARTMLSNGFKYYNASQKMWIHFEKDSNLMNVIIFHHDFEFDGTLSIRLASQMEMFKEETLDEGLVEECLV